MNSKKTLKSFAAQAIIAAVLAITVTCGALGIFSFRQIDDCQNSLIESTLLSTAFSVSQFIDADALLALEAGGEDDPYYNDLLDRCLVITEELGLEYIYVLARAPGSSAGKFVFFLDTDLEAEAVIGELYDIDEFAAIEEALSGRGSISDAYEDEWGVFISGYAPIYDNAGKVAAVVGVDYDTNAINTQKTGALVSYILMCLAILAVIIAVYIAVTFVNYSGIKSEFAVIVARLRDFAEQSAENVKNFNGQSELLSASASESAGAISDISDASGNILAKVKLTDGGMRKITEYFSETSREMTAGTAKMDELSDKITEIKNSAYEIAKVIASINTIAKKTKILALNAEVEAARFGDAGKSFAVVASEVGTLAQNVGDTAKTTTGIIERNLNFTKEAVADTESVKAILTAAGDGINNLTKIISEVSEASSEQTRNINTMTKDISTITESANKNAATAENISGSANGLTVMAEELHTLIDGIKRAISGNSA